jgi:hypothetical protein
MSIAPDVTIAMQKKMKLSPDVVNLTARNTNEVMVAPMVMSDEVCAKFIVSLE